jgi:hypothetical protein
VAKFNATRGSTSRIVWFFLGDSASTTGAGKTGLTNGSGALNITVRREKSGSVTTYTGANIGAVATLGTWADPGAGKVNFKEVSSANLPGVYEVHFQDTLFGTSDTSRWLAGMVTATGVVPTPFEFELDAFDLQIAKQAVTVAAADVSGNVAADVQTIKTQTVTCTAGVTVGVFVGNATAALAVDGSGRIDVGKILGTASAGAAGYVGLDWAHITAATTAVDLSGTTIKNLDNNPPGTLTAAQIATGVWQDAVAGDFTTAGSIGKSLFTSGVVPGGAGGILISGANTGPWSVSGGVTFSNSGGSGFTCTATGGGGNGIAASGNAGGAGLSAVGGGSGGTGISGLGGAGGGTGIFGRSDVAGGNGVAAEAFGTDDAISAVAAGGHGFSAFGGGAGDGVHAEGGTTGRGVHILEGVTVAAASGSAVDISAAAGHGVSIAAGGANAHGFVATGGTSGVSDGMRLVAGFGGVDLRANIPSVPTANQNADALLDRASGVETSFTLRQAMRLVLAALAGKLKVVGNTVTIRDVNDAKDRIAATTDAANERTAVTYDVS